jgi:hypothetical protein
VLREKPMKPKVSEQWISEALEKCSLGSFPIRHSGDLECVQGETFET